MLYKTTFSVSALSLEERTYSHFVALLIQLTQNCLIFVDSQGGLEAKLAEAIKGLPAKYQYQAKELHKKLKSKGRIIKYNSDCDLSVLKEDICEFHRSTLGKLPDLFIFVGNDCCLESHTIPKWKKINLEEYVLSTRFMGRKNEYILSDGQFDKLKMEEEIFVPLFETAKTIKLIDRYIGRSMIGKNGNIEPIVERYQRNLIWLLEIFDRFSSQAKRRFEIYTGVNSQNLSKDEVLCLHNKMIDFSDLVKSKFNSFEFSLKVKRETLQYQEMPHARYLITNQVSVLVERGFDLLWNDHQMDNAGLNSRTEQPKVRDVAVVLISEPGKVESSIRKLDDLVK
jgi:hypothetical protein